MIKEKVVNENEKELPTKSNLVEAPNRNVHPEPSMFKKYAEGALYMGTIYGVMYGVPVLLISGVGYGVYRLVRKD